MHGMKIDVLDHGLCGWSTAWAAICPWRGPRACPTTPHGVPVKIKAATPS